MKNIINFPKNKIIPAKIKPNSKPITENISFFYPKTTNKTQGNTPNKKESQAFLTLIKKWPCFKSINPNINFEKLLEAYYESELNSAQNNVIEYIFHMHDANSPFDICGSLYSWDEDDRNFFILSLNLHIELIEHIKKTL
jgi:hypothetical protein